MKFLQKINIYLYLFFLIFLLYFFGFINVFAYSSNTTYYNVSMYDYKTALENKTCGNSNMYEFVNKFISSVDWSSSRYQVYISVRLDPNLPYSYEIFFVTPTSLNTEHGHDLLVRGNNSYGSFKVFENYSPSSKSALFRIYNVSCSSSYDLLNSYTLTNLINYAQTGDNTILNNYDSNIGIFSTGLSNTWSFSETYNTSFNNNNSYNVSLWPYFSSYQLVMPSENYISSSTYSSYYFKPVHIIDNDTTYTWTQNLPTYYDLYYIDNTIHYDNFNPLDNVIYTNFSPSDYSSVNFTLTMNNPIELYSYTNNFDILTSCYGRINHNNNYYTYNRIDCSYSNEADDITNNRFKWTFSDLIFSDSNGNIITDFSSYDKLFSIVSFSIKDRDLPYYSTDLEINHNKGDLLYTSFKGQIYDSFDNLQPLFKFYLSSNSPYSYDVYSRAVGLSTFTNTYIYWTQYNSTNLTPTTIQGNISTDFSKMSVSNSINSSIMVFQDHIDNIYSKIDFIFDDNLVISYSSTSSNNFYYIDSNGNISNSNINVDFDYNHFSNSYNISYYVDKVNSFINGLSEDFSQISSLTQQFYDDSPEILQAFILVIFIISNIYFVYVLMRK